MCTRTKGIILFNQLHGSENENNHAMFKTTQLQHIGLKNLTMDYFFKALVGH